MLLLPQGAELNPLAAHTPAIAIVAKLALLTFLLAAPLGRYARRVRVFGALAWTVGACSNIAVLMGG